MSHHRHPRPRRRDRPAAAELRARAAAVADGRRRCRTRSACPGHLMVEAGTGVGKSFAYLVPAIQAACAATDGRVVVSTHTIGLQEQLIRKDIPFLQSVMPEKFAAAAREGPRQLSSASAGSQSPINAAMSLLTEAGAIEQLDTLMALGRSAPRTAAAAISIFARCRRSGNWSKAIRAIAWARSAPIMPIVFTSRPARNIQKAKMLDRQSRPLFRRPCPAFAQPRGRHLAEISGRHLRRSPHAGRCRRRASRACRSRAARPTACSIACTWSGAARRSACSSCTAIAADWRQVHHTRTVDASILQQHPRLASATTNSRPSALSNSDSLRVREPEIVADMLSAEFKRLSAPARQDCGHRQAMTRSRSSWNRPHTAANRWPPTWKPGWGKNCRARFTGSKAPASAAIGCSWPALRSRSARSCARRFSTAFPRRS